MMSWEAKSLTCRNCGTGPGCIIDKTPDCGHSIMTFLGDPNVNAERVLWCKYCGVIVLANRNEGIGTEDWLIPIYTESGMQGHSSSRKAC